jgi:hypothetical protein
VISVHRTTYVPFWTIGTDRRLLSYWPQDDPYPGGWGWTRRTDKNVISMIFVPGLVVHL